LNTILIGNDFIETKSIYLTYFSQPDYDYGRGVA